MKNCLTVLLLVVCAAVAGCARGEKIEAIYTMNALPSPATSGGTTAQLLVPEPRALEALNTNKIAVKPTAVTLSYYPSVALEDTSTKVLQRILLDTFQNTGRVKAVGLPGQSLLINYQVVTEVRAFQAETYEGDRARVEVSVKLLDDSNGRVVSDRIFTKVVPMTGDGADAAADGINRAAQELAADVVAWTLTTI